MSDEPKTGSQDQPAEVIDLSHARDKVRTRDKVAVLRQDRAENALAKRFHDAMGWKGKPAAGKKKKPKKKR